VEARTSSPLLPLLAAPGFTQAYRTLSWRHGVDVLNQYLLAAPAALLALPALRLRPFLRDADAVFLLGSAAVPVLFTLVANPEIGPFRDWDLMSIGALPLTLAVGVGFARRGGPGPLRDAAVLCGAAALHTAGWVAVNAAPGPSAARFHGLLETAALSSHAKAYGWETWANHERAAGQPEAALVAYESALRADPTNHRYWVYRGTVQFDLGRPERALAAFARAKELEPDYMPTWLNEGLALFKTGAWEKATKSLEHALELQPGLDEAEFILAHCYRKLGRRTEAAEHLERLLARTPDAVEPLFLLGNIYSEIDDVPRATACYRRMVELAPRDHRGHYNLGVCYMNQGRESQARAQFAEVLRLAPGSAEAATIRARLGGTTSP
jgi:tetratricopeptide (TPR) repeat protein